MSSVDRDALLQTMFGIMMIGAGLWAWRIAPSSARFVWHPLWSDPDREPEPSALLLERVGAVIGGFIGLALAATGLLRLIFR